MEIDKMRPIAISFKNNCDDREIYEWILSHSNYSGFIKDILKREMKGTTKECSNELIDLGDF